MLLDVSYSSLTWTFLAAASYSASMMTGKKATKYASPLAVMVAFLFPCALVGLGWLLVQPDFHIPPSYWLPFSITLAGNIVANLCYFRALKTAQVSLMGSTLGTIPIFSALVAKFYLGESLAFHQWFGIVLSFVGLIAMYIPNKKSPEDNLNVFAFFTTIEGWLIIVTAICWAVSSPFDKQASLIASPQMHNFLIYVFMIPPCLAVLFLQGRASELLFSPRQICIIFAAGLLRGVGFAAQLLAVIIMPVGIFESLKRIFQQFMVIAGGKIFFDEEITKFKIIGAFIFVVAIPLTLLK